MTWNLKPCSRVDLFWMKFYLNFDEKFRCFLKIFSVLFTVFPANFKLEIYLSFLYRLSRNLFWHEIWNLLCSRAEDLFWMKLSFENFNDDIFKFFLDKTCRWGVCLLFGHHPIFLFWHKNSGQCQLRIEIKWSENSKV